MVCRLSCRFDPGSTLQGLTAPREGATEAARRTRFFPSDATIGTTNFAALLSFSANAPSLFRIPFHRTLSPTIAHAGDGFCQLLGRSPEAAASGRRTPSPRLTNMGLSGSADNTSPNVFWDQQIFRERLFSCIADYRRTA